MSPSHLLLGGGGVLGTGFRSVLDHAGADVTWLRPRWDEEGHAAATLRAALVRLGERADSVTVIWAAGSGHIGAGAESMRSETAVVRSLCDVLVELPPARRKGISLLFASSAGALYGGHAHGEVVETDPPCPATPYGWAKLTQEGILHSFAELTGCPVLVCRYSNLYGLADGCVTARGLISTAIRAARLRQPMVVYVSPDTRRDHVYNTDAALVSLRALNSAPGGMTTILVCEGETRAVSEILALVGRVSRRRVPATFAEHPDTQLQPRILRFRRPTGGVGAGSRTPMEVAIHRMLRAPMNPRAGPAPRPPPAGAP